MAAVAALMSRVLRPFRLVKFTVAANLFNQLVVALSQLIVIPLLVSTWGTEGLGTWLLLTAIPNYLTISDFGFTTSAKSDMAMRAAKGDFAGAQTTVSSVAMLLIMALSAVALIYFGATWTIDWVNVLNLSNLTADQAKIILAFGFVQIVGYQAFLLSASVIRAANMPATEVMLSALSRLAETTAFVVAAFVGQGLVGAAAAWAVTRLLMTLMLWIFLYRRFPALVPRRELIDWARIKVLLKPSLSYVTLPLANAISIQGTMLILGATSGPAIAAAFATSRIVTRLGVSAANVLNFAYVPQYSYASGKGDAQLFRGLLISHGAALFVGTTLYVVTMTFLSGWFVSLLSHNQMSPNGTVLALLTAAAVFEMAWTFSTSVGSALNRIGVIAVMWLSFSILGLLILSAMQSHLDAILVSAAVAATHGAMFVVFIVWLRSFLRTTASLKNSSTASGT